MNILASIFNLGGPDLLIIFLVILLLFGAKKLPDLARGMGQAVREFSKAKDEFEHEVTKQQDQVNKLAEPPGRVARSSEATIEPLEKKDQVS